MVQNSLEINTHFLTKLVRNAQLFCSKLVRNGKKRFATKLVRNRKKRFTTKLFGNDKHFATKRVSNDQSFS